MTTSRTMITPWIVLIVSLTSSVVLAQATEDKRNTISLNGDWQMAQSQSEAPPAKYNHHGPSAWVG